MANVIRNARVQIKRDTAVNWEKNNPVLLNGEEIIVDTNSGEIRKKIGDGSKTYTQLPFTDEKLKSLISNKVDKIEGKNLSTHDFNNTYKTKLDGIEEGANKYTHPNLTTRVLGFYKIAVNEEGHVNNVTTVSKDDITKLGIPAQDTVYTHPDSHPATIIEQDTTHKFVTDDQIATWNAKASTAIATKSNNGLMSKEDKTKLDGIEEGANKYIHPTSHPATIINQDTTHKFVTETQINTWNAKLDPIALTNHINNKSNPHTVTKSQVGLGNVTNDAQVKRSEIGVANGVAKLDENCLIPSAYLPSYVDDVIEGYYYNSKFYSDSTHNNLINGESSKIYIDLKSNKTYRWTGTGYALISETLALGETSSTAYSGDKGKANAVAISAIQSKLNGIEEGANKYTHPVSHPATMITTDNTHRFVSDTQISTWNNKASTTVATTTTNGLMSSTDKIKLNDLASRIEYIESKLQNAIFYR